MSAIFFETVEDAFAAHTLPVLLYVRIGGVAIDATEARVSHSVNRPVGLATVYCAAPRPASLELNATIEIEMGYPGASRRTFLGFVVNDESVTDDRGRMVRIDGVGWASRLAAWQPGDIEITGPVSLKDAFRSLCQLRDIPTYLSDDTTTTDGTTEIILGGNTLINDGHIRLDDTTSPLDWQTRTSELFGYRVFDSPDAAVRQARVSGLAGPPLTEGALTTDLTQFDYVKATAALPLRETPGIAGASLGSFAVGDIGRLVGTEIIPLNGFNWMEFVFPEIGRGWVYLATGAGVPYFYQMIPDVAPAVYQEGVNCFRLSHARDVTPMANYIEVLGARYTADDGGVVEIRAIPDEVPYAEELAPLGVNKYTVSSQDITTDEQAQWVRNATEVDRGEPYEVISWDTWGRADLQPGDSVTLDASSTHGIDATDYWLIDLDQSVSDQGYRASMTAWRGSGEALAAGNDCRTETVTTNVIHAGTQNISWYRDSSPDSVRDPYDPDSEVADRRWVVVVNLTVTDEDYSSLRLLGICHGTNSINNTTAITGSKVEIWQLDDPTSAESDSNEFSRVGSVDLPTTNEELRRRRNYASTDRYWTAFSLPLSGSLKVGAAKLIIVSGESDDGEVDDFEIDNLEIKYCGVGEPDFASADDPS